MKALLTTRKVAEAAGAKSNLYDWAVQVDLISTENLISTEKFFSVESITVF